MNHYKINFSDFPSGIYFVNIQSSEFSVMRKITLLK
ncbi:MAG: T9SS type A sorting domain-containing protein [Fidelibacterota bacterium]